MEEGAGSEQTSSEVVCSEVACSEPSLDGVGGVSSSGTVLVAVVSELCAGLSVVSSEVASVELLEREVGGAETRPSAQRTRGWKKQRKKVDKWLVHR